MSLETWHKFGWLKPHRTDEQELANLLAIADRDIVDATSTDLSNDWRFGIAYNAALKLCTMLLYDAGYMPEKALAHYRTLLSIEFTLGADRKDDAAYLDSCRAKRNHVEYDYVEGPKTFLKIFKYPLDRFTQLGVQYHHPDRRIRQKVSPDVF